MVSLPQCGRRRRTTIHPQSSCPTNAKVILQGSFLHSWRKVQRNFLPGCPYPEWWNSGSNCQPCILLHLEDAISLTTWLQLGTVLDRHPGILALTSLSLFSSTLQVHLTLGRPRPENLLQKLPQNQRKNWTSTRSQQLPISKYWTDSGEKMALLSRM